MANSNFLVGEFRPVKEAYDGKAGGGRWLGDEFHKSIGEKSFPVDFDHVGPHLRPHFLPTNR